MSKPTLGGLIEELAKAAGIAVDDGDLKAFLSNVTISGAEIPEKINTALTTNLHTIESAKAHKDVINHFRANLYDGVDNELNNTLKELGYADQLKEILAAEKSTPKKMVLAMKKLQELEAAKADGKGGKELQEKINTLTKQVNEFNSAKAAEIEAAVNAVKSEYGGKFEKMALSNLFSGKKLANPMGVDQSLLHQLAEGVISKAIAEKGYQKQLTDNGFALLTKEGTEVFEGTKKITFNDFVDKILLDSKLIEVGGGQQQQNSGQGQQQHQQQQAAHQQQQPIPAIQDSVANIDAQLAKFN